MVAPNRRRCITKTAGLGAVIATLLALTGCSGASSTSYRTPDVTTPRISTTSSAASSGTTSAGVEATFPVSAFAAITEEPVTGEFAARLQTALAQHDIAGGGGMSATVMTAQGTWSGTAGVADGVRDLRVDDQFAIASITKSIVAAQVMLMAEAGELALDDPVAEHLPVGIGFDTNSATIRQLLGHRSGLPDYYEAGPLGDIDSDARRVWTPAELLDLVPTDRTLPGSSFSYAETNYLILKLVIEHLHQRPLAEVVRAGALAIDGLERLVYQPDESPTEPMAMPAGASHDVLGIRGGHLPSLASATAYQASGGIASDARSLARWWRALCAGQIVTPSSLGEMSRFEPAGDLGYYGLGAYNPARGYAEGFGHTGQLPGYMSWAACLPEDRAVIVVLTNHEVDDGHLAFSSGLARPLIEALRAP